MSIKVEKEVKIDSEPCVVAWDNKLYVGTEDGFIKAFDEYLTPETFWSAHEVQLFALAAGNGCVYSASNDGGVRVWSPEGVKLAEFPQPESDVGVLHVFGKTVCTGDESGNVIIYENNIEKASYNVLEEVRDLQFNPPFLFTVRDLDITVTEIKPEESKTKFVTRHTMEGRGPLRLLGNHLLAMARGGNNLQLIDASLDTTFKKLHEVKVSDMIVTSLATSGDHVYTAGWDGQIRRWRIVRDKLEQAGHLSLGGCVNSLVATGKRVYAVTSGGMIFSITSA